MTIPSAVIDAYALSHDGARQVSGGLINRTFRATSRDGETVVAVQELHPIFGAEVNLDIEAITETLAAASMPTPRLVRTKGGEAWVESEGAIWRAITWLDGQCFSELPSLAHARAGAYLAGKFHRLLSTVDYEFRFARAGVHDTPEHFRKLREAKITGFSEERDADALRAAILQQAEELPALEGLPLRICHGDLKLANILFTSQGSGLCLVDLDTMGMQTIAYELGDALRSWGNSRGEDVEVATIREDVVREAALGYASGSQGLLSAEEISSVIPGLETICLELSARFCVDIYNDSYFGWDSSTYTSRRAHNLVRARGQLALAKSVAANRAALESAWCSAF